MRQVETSIATPDPVSNPSKAEETLRGSKRQRVGAGAGSAQLGLCSKSSQAAKV
jgi:hypothetical protein